MMNSVDDVVASYQKISPILDRVLGASIHPDDPGKLVIESWVQGLDGPILDAGAGTGRWTRHLHNQGLEVVGMEPVPELVNSFHQAHPEIPMIQAQFLDAPRLGSWSGILARYSLIHLEPEEMNRALNALVSSLDDGGSLLMSFFGGHQLSRISHPIAPALVWPVEYMKTLLRRRGMKITAQHQSTNSPHAFLAASKKSLDNR